MILSFYNGLNIQFKRSIDVACGGYILSSNEDHAWRVLENMVESSQNQESRKTFSITKENHMIHSDRTSLIQSCSEEFHDPYQQLIKQMKQLEARFNKPTIQHQSQSMVFPDTKPISNVHDPNLS